MARDPTYLAFVEEVWEGLEAVFLGFNAHLFLAEVGRLPPQVVAAEEVAPALAKQGYRVGDGLFHREAKVYSSRGGLALLGAFEDWAQKAIEL